MTDKNWNTLVGPIYSMNREPESLKVFEIMEYVGLAKVFHSFRDLLPKAFLNIVKFTEYVGLTNGFHGFLCKA